MSHITTGGAADMTLTDLNAVRAACTQLGCSLLKQSHFRSYNNRAGKVGGNAQDEVGEVEYVIRAKEQAQLVINGHAQYNHAPFDVALVKAKGGWQLAMDTWCEGEGMCHVVGQPVDLPGGTVIAPRLIQEYRLASAILAAQEVGDEIEVERLDNGEIRLLARVGERV